MASTKGLFIVGAKRTPFCQYGGALRELPASHAFAAAAKDAIHSARLDPSLIDETIVGNVNYLSQCDGGKTPRYCGIYSGVPIEKPALGVSNACGTGLQSIITGAVNILFGTSKIILTGGTDIMSALPMLVRNVRFGTTIGASYKYEDHIQREMVDSYSGLTLPRIAEELAKKYGIKRQEMDEFALNSHLKWKAALESKSLAEEVTSLTVNINKKEILVEEDQPLFLEMEQLKQLPSEDGGIVTSGNSSSPADGAAAVLLASEEAIRNHDLTPLVRIAGWAYSGVDPNDTEIAASEAVRKLLAEQRMTVGDVDLFEIYSTNEQRERPIRDDRFVMDLVTHWLILPGVIVFKLQNKAAGIDEINETFASQVLATSKELKIEMGKVNVGGGALALGHPVSATGTRMATSLVHALRRRGGKRAIAASNCGSGQGIALMIETL